MSPPLNNSACSTKQTLNRVISRVSAEVTKPFPDRLCDGIFTITTELSPIASPAFEVGR
jgi:exosome complex component RRP45